MEIILAIVVASAVIFFGALISMGNERQRKEIDRLREQVVLWAVQDLKIKREQLAQTVQVPNPLDWLNKSASRICGYELNLQILEVIEDPQSLVCIPGGSSALVVFSPLSPNDLRRVKNYRKNRLSQLPRQNPLLHLPKNVTVHEMSVLNQGYLFDLELRLAWETLTGQNIEHFNSIWIYEYSKD